MSGKFVEKQQCTEVKMLVKMLVKIRSLLMSVISLKFKRHRQNISISQQNEIIRHGAFCFFHVATSVSKKIA